MIVIPPTYKLVIASLALGALLVAGIRVYDTIYDAGFNAATVAEQQKTQKAIDAAVDIAKADWKRSASSAKKQSAREARIREKNRVVAKSIPAAVNALAPECRDLGPGIRRLFNIAIESDDEPSGGGPDTNESDDEVRSLHSGGVR